MFTRGLNTVVVSRADDGVYLVITDEDDRAMEFHLTAEETEKLKEAL